MRIIKLKRAERLKQGLLKIGEVAREAGLLPSCPRFYTQLGFLKVEAITQGGYWLYKKEDTIKALSEIEGLVKKGLTLAEITKIKTQGGKMHKPPEAIRKMARNILKRGEGAMKKLAIIFFAIWIYGVFWAPGAAAGDIEAKLNSADGSTNFEVQDSSAVIKAQVDSSGNAVIKGGARLDADGVEHTTAEELIVDGRVGIGTTAPTAYLHLKAGTAATGTAPIKLGVGANLTTPEAGTIEFDGTNLYYTDSVPTRRTLATATGGVAWSTITAPSANLALAMGEYTSTFSYSAATGADTNLFNLTDAPSNTGTGYMMDITTAAGSVLNPLHVKAAGTEALTVIKNANVGIGTTSPSAYLHVKAGTAAAGTAPLKLTTGTNLTTPEAGAIEYDGTSLYYTNSIGTRQTLSTAVSGANAVLSNLTVGAVAINTSLISDADSTDDLGSSTKYWANTYTDQLYTTGNVGIGTTDPAQKLHVEGQCVTGDTLLPIVRLESWKARKLEKGGNINGIRFRKIEGLSGGDGFSGEDIQDNQGISEGRAIWSYKSVAPGSAFSVAEHSGGEGSLSYEGIHSVSISSQRVGVRSDNTAKDEPPFGISDKREGSGVIGGSQQYLYKIKQSNQVDEINNHLPIQPFSHNAINDSFQLFSHIEYVPIVNVREGDYVLSLNEQTDQIEPHRINGLLDMGTKPVFKLTTASGRYIKTTGNHPYLVKLEGWKAGKLESWKAGSSSPATSTFSNRSSPLANDVFHARTEWRKVSELKVGDEIAVAKQERLSSAVGVFPGINAVNNNTIALEVKTNAVFADSESVSSGRDIDQGFGERQGITAGEVQLNLFNDSLLQLDGKLFEFPLSAGSELDLLKHYQDKPNSRLIFSKGTNPNFLASSMPFLSRNTSLGLIGRCSSMASISHPIGLWNTYSLDEAFSSSLASMTQSIFHNEYVSNIKYLGEPSLPATTPTLKSFALRPDFLSSSGIFANLSRDSSLTDSLVGRLVNDLDFILPSPFSLMSEVYHRLKLVSSRLLEVGEAHAAQPPSNPQLRTSNSRILWDKIVSIEYVGYERVYDIEVEGTHNFVAGHFIEEKTDSAFSDSSSSIAALVSSDSSSPLATGGFFGGIIAHNTYISSNIGIGNTAPSAYLHIKAGTIAAGTAPIKLTAGTNLTAAEAGAIEYDGTSLYYTDGTSTRRTLSTSTSGANVLLSNLTAGAVAVNTDIVSDTDSEDDLGSSTVNWGNVYTDNLKSAAADTALTIEHDGSDQDIILKVNDGGVDTTVMTLDGATGYVGIGTTAPGAPLDISKPGSTATKVVDGYGYGLLNLKDSTSDYPGIFFEGLSGVHAMIRIYNGDGFDFATFANGTSQGTKLRIQEDGKVGVGETSPGSTLSVKGGLSVGTTVDYSQKASPSGGAIIEGNVGIGNTAPSAYLHIKAGTIAAGTAPIKLTAGTNLTAAEAGAIEYDGTSLYYTDGTSTRRTLSTSTSGANVLLSNLTVGSVAVNTDIVSDADSEDDLGSSTVNWGNVYTDNLKSAAADTALTIEHDGSDQDIYFKVNDGGVDTTVMTLDGATGYVGIGTTAPGYQLEIKDPDTNALGGIYFNAASYVNVPQPGSVANKIIANAFGYGFSTDTITLTTPPTFGIGLAANRAGSLMVLRNNNVTNPVLQIEKGAIGMATSIIQDSSTLSATYRGLFLGSNFSNNYYTQLNTDYSSWGIDIGGIDNSSYAGTTDTFSIIRQAAGAAHTARTWPFLINSSGYVGIGTTAPTSPLQVVGLPVYANNAAAVAGGLTAGALYRTGADPDPVCVVH